MGKLQKQNNVNGTEISKRFLNMLYFIGLGLGDAKDITVKGLEIVKSAKKVFLEHYTSILSCGKGELEEFYGRNDLILADRDLVESGADEILEDAKDDIVAFLVVGDPFGATTHSDLMIRAREKGIQTKTLHNASIMNAIGCCGLQLYSFGETVSIPFWSEDWKPDSFYDKIQANLDKGMHTLCLLDIKVAERTVENMMKNRNIFEPPRFMTVAQAIEQLLKIKETKENGQITEDTLGIGVARVGQDSQKLVSGKLKELLLVDMGEPLHSLVIPGKMHELEQNAVDYLKIE